MNRRRIKIAALVLLLGFVLMAQCFAQEVNIDVKTHTLPNGLKVLIVENHEAPIVAFYRYHKVGGVNEYSGMFGASHLLEHMMFKGTQKIGTWDYKAEVPIMKKIDKLVDEIDKERAKSLSGYEKVDKEKITRLWGEVKKLQDEQRKYVRKNEIDYIYKSEGGRGLNASTGYDATDYYISLPSNKLEVWAFIESERMKAPVFREFYSERDVVYEERRMRTDNTPNGTMFENFFSHLFVAIPYGQDVVGWASDIESMRREQVEKYFRKYYSPGNTILAVVGDVKEKEVMDMVNKYFASIPPQPLPDPIYATEPEQKGERRITVKYDANPMFYIGYHGPRPGEPDQYALDILGNILSSGRTGRFYKNLVKTNKAFYANGGNWTMGYENIFVIGASPKNPVTSEQLEKDIYAEIERLKTEPVSQEELQKVFNQIDAQYIRLMDSRMSLGVRLAGAEAWTGSYKNFFKERELLKKVTPEDIMRVANKYLTQDNRTVTTLVKDSPKKEEGKESHE